jgi:hypothetical protein
MDKSMATKKNATTSEAMDLASKALSELLEASFKNGDFKKLLPWPKDRREDKSGQWVVKNGNEVKPLPTPEERAAAKARFIEESVARYRRANQVANQVVKAITTTVWSTKRKSPRHFEPIEHFRHTIADLQAEHEHLLQQLQAVTQPALPNGLILTQPKKRVKRTRIKYSAKLPADIMVIFHRIKYTSFIAWAVHNACFVAAANTPEEKNTVKARYVNDVANEYRSFKGELRKVAVRLFAKSIYPPGYEPVMRLLETIADFQAKNEILRQQLKSMDSASSSTKPR